MSNETPNLLYAQSGGVTAVINRSAAAVIATARKHTAKIARVYAARNGILGVLREQLIDTTGESAETIEALGNTPGGAFGSCRYKLKGLAADAAKYQRFLQVCQAHNIGYFLYNGGNDSADTAYKVSQLAATSGYALTCIGVPKTIDNDLALTDVCPGFGSAAKYTAISVLEASLDVASMSETSTKVFVYEVMGRHAGWLAAAGGLAGKSPDEAPQVILFPEIKFDEASFLARVDATVRKVGWCVVVVSEGLKYADGRFVSEAGGKDAFGHAQLGGVAPTLARMVTEKLGYKHHWAVPDYLQRSARHIASGLDAELAWKVGEAAVEYAVAGRNAVMPVIKRVSDAPYRYEIHAAELAEVANNERFMPREFITEDGFGITDAARRYLEPLILGESYPPYQAGLPAYAVLKNELIAARLPSWTG